MSQIADLTKRAGKIRANEAANVTKAVKSIKKQMRKHGLTLAHLGATGAAKGAAVAKAKAGKAKAKAGKSKAKAGKSKAKAGKSKAKAGKSKAKAGKSLKANDKRLKVKPKYRNKKGETWAGRGKLPRWMVAELKAGKKKDDFLIQ